MEQTQTLEQRTETPSNPRQSSRLRQYQHQFERTQSGRYRSVPQQQVYMSERGIENLY